MNGEGFAFFRWHTLMWRWFDCPGFGHGCECDPEWKELRTKSRRSPEHLK
jgi:hypothetical protein